MISNNLKSRLITSLILLAILFLIYNFNFVLVYFLILLGVMSILEFCKLSKNIFSNQLRKFLLILYL